MSSELYEGSDSDPGTWRGRGDTNDVYVYPVVHDTRVQGRDWLFYGDDDNALMVSYNGGRSFSPEGWQWSGAYGGPSTPKPGVSGGAATAIVLDQTNANRIYVAVTATGAHGFSNGNTCCGGVVYGDYVAGTPPAVGRWEWYALGNQSSFPKTGGHIDLVRSATGTFIAAVYGRGVYRLDGTNNWTNAGQVWNPIPACGTETDPVCWKVYRVYREPSSGRLYAAVGYPLDPAPSVPVSGETGIWESVDGGVTWSRISDPDSDTGSGMDKEPVTDIAFLDANTMLASTWFAYGNSSVDGSGNWIGDGGVYKGTRDGSGVWTWSKVLSRPIMTGVAVSQASSTIAYAHAAQRCCGNILPGQQAGVYKSVDGGQTWTLLANEGLMSLRHGRLYTSDADPLKLYAATIGAGLFEGTITCGPVAEGFPDSDGDGTADCADDSPDISLQVAMSEGSIVSGSSADLHCGGPDDTYERLREQTSGNKRKMTKIWTFDNVPTGQSYELRVEGYKAAGGGGAADDFNFSLVTKSAGSTCGSGDAYGSAILTVTKTADDDQLQTTSLGTVSNPVVCVRVQDSARSSDSQTDDLWLDRVCLSALPACSDADGDGYAASCMSCSNSMCPAVDCDDGDPQVSPGLTEGPFGNPTCTDGKDNNCNGLVDSADAACAQSLPDADADADTSIGPGTTFSGTYLDTRSSNDVYQSLQESVQAGKSRLVKTWRFDNVPAGTHRLHIEGYRTTVDGDNFHFFYSTSPNSGFTAISGSTINQSTPDQVIDSSTFGTGLSGTIYIQIRDTMPNNAQGLDLVHVDELKITTNP
jgi:hypothetical protein